MNGDCCTEASDQSLEILRKIPFFKGMTLPDLHKIFEKHTSLLSQKAN